MIKPENGKGGTYHFTTSFVNLINLKKGEDECKN